MFSTSLYPCFRGTRKTWAVICVLSNNQTRVFYSIDEISIVSKLTWRHRSLLPAFHRSARLSTRVQKQPSMTSLSNATYQVHFLICMKRRWLIGRAIESHAGASGSNPDQIHLEIWKDISARQSTRDMEISLKVTSCCDPSARCLKSASQVTKTMRSMIREKR